MLISYDPVKNSRNIRDRGLSFERAGDFDFTTAVVREDLRRIYPENRLVALGFLDGRLHALCFTLTSMGIRIISFRKANRREKKDYEQTFYD
jgi:uncharacterized DUF497 family protein